MMKIVTIVFLFLVSTAVQAEVYKCTTETGRVVYQSNECADGREQSEISITPFDQQKYEEAHAKMQQDVKQWQEGRQAQAEADRQKRDMQLQEQTMQTARDIAESARNQAEILDPNTQAILRSNHGRSRGYYRQSDLYGE